MSQSNQSGTNVVSLYKVTLRCRTETGHEVVVYDYVVDPNREQAVEHAKLRAAKVYRVSAFEVLFAEPGTWTQRFSGEDACGACGWPLPPKAPK